MLRKALTLGMVFILVLSLLAVSMITCFTYEAEAHYGFWCVNLNTGEVHHLCPAPTVGPWACGDGDTH